MRSSEPTQQVFTLNYVVYKEAEAQRFQITCPKPRARSGSYKTSIDLSLRSPSCPPCEQPPSLPFYFSVYLKETSIPTCHSWLGLTWTLSDQRNGTSLISRSCLTMPDGAHDGPRGLHQSGSRSVFSSSEAPLGQRKTVAGTWIMEFRFWSSGRVKSLTPHCFKSIPPNIRVFCGVRSNLNSICPCKLCNPTHVNVNSGSITTWLALRK